MRPPTKQQGILMTLSLHIPRRLAILGSLAVVAISACGSDSDSGAASTSPAATAASVAPASSGSSSAVASDSTTASTADSTTATSAAADSDESFEVAYLSASSANTWLTSSKAQIDTVAEANHVTVTEFDGQFDAALQTTQLQDIVSSGKYDGVVVVAINGPGLIPDVEAAVAAGMQVVVLNQVVGTDLTTSDPQVAGVAASVMVPPKASGTRLGELTTQACAKLDPCNVAFIYGIKGIPLDDAIREGFDETIAGTATIKVVAEGEGKYLGPDGGITATQNILQLGKDIDVIVGADQSIQGAAIELGSQGVEGVKLIGVGGSEAAIAGITDGTWFGGVYGAPADEGRIAMEALIAAMKDGTVTGGVDPLVSLPDNGLITAANVADFTAQWAG